MGFFSGKKVTYSGVGSAIQNLHSGELSNSLTSAVLSANLNNTDVGKAFKDSLASGTGIQLRNFIDYAYKKGYTNTLGWEVTMLEGDTFSDGSSYLNYLSKYVYPSSSNEITTPKVEKEKKLISESSYVNGSNVVTTKLFKKIETYTTTVTNINFNFICNYYYQGANSQLAATWRLMNSPQYQALSDSIKETAITFSSQLAFGCYLNGGALIETFPTGVVIALINDKNLAPTISGNIFASTSEILAQRYTYTYEAEKEYGDGSTSTYWETTTGPNSRLFKSRINSESVYRHPEKYVFDPVTALGLTKNEVSINIVNVIFMESSTSSITKSDPDGYGDWWSGHANWYVSKAIIMYVPSANTSNKILLSNVTVNKVVDKITTNSTVETNITEKYINGTLTSSSSIEGATESTSNLENLETSTSTHDENYIQGSGNVLLDSIINNTRKFTESFCPTLPIKTWGELCSPSWGNLYTEERKLYKKLSKKTLDKWDDFVQSFKGAGDDAKMIYYFLGIPINVDSEFANEYFFHFFKWLSMNFGGVFTSLNDGIYFSLLAKSHTDFHITYNFRAIYKIIKGKVPVPCKTHGYARYIVIGNDEPEDMTTTSWKGGFGPVAGEGVSSRWFSFFRLFGHQTGKTTSITTINLERENYPDLTDDEFNALQAEQKYTTIQYKSGKSSLTFYYKINDNLYERVYISNFVFSHLVRSTALIYYLKASLRRDWKTAIDDDGTNDKDAGFAPIIIPIARGALESMGWYRQSNVFDLSHNVIISGYDQKTVKKKWYQSGIFSVVLAVVAVVCSVFTGGASLSLLAFVIMVVKVMVIMIVVKAITKMVDKYIGGTLGAIVKTVATVIAVVYLSYNFGILNNTGTLWSSLNTWDGYMTLTKTVVSSVNDSFGSLMQAQYTDVQSQYMAMQQDQSSKQQQIDAWNAEMASWGNNNITDIIVNSTYTTSSTTTNSTSQFIAEDPDTFFYRVFDLDFYDLNKSYISDFEDYQNNIELPC